MTAPVTRWLRATIARWMVFLAAWILIAGAGPPDLPAGAFAALLASWASLILYPPSLRRGKVVPSLVLVLRLPLQSVIAGYDVACRALDPRLPLNPGFIRCGSAAPPGPARAAFATIASLVPGTLPVGSAPDGTLLVHCIDQAQPVTASLARDEAIFLRALGGARANA